MHSGVLRLRMVQFFSYTESTEWIVGSMVQNAQAETFHQDEERNLELNVKPLPCECCMIFFFPFLEKMSVFQCKDTRPFKPHM